VARRRFPSAHFVAVEKHEQRMVLLKKRLSLACGFQNMELLQADARDWLCESDRFFDRILLDAPCSGLGTILSHPEFLITKRDTDFNAKQELQIKLLSAAMDRLKSGGELIYSVCSFLQAETEEVVSRSLKTGYEVKMVESLLGEDQLQKEFGTLLCVSEKLGNQIFYVARIVKK
jgi:16S rRNA (cytosine967-C5)-methyltransferase